MRLAQACAFAGVRKTPNWPRSWANFSLYSCIPTGMHGPTRIFWANVTTFSLTGLDAAGPLVGERHLAFLGPQHDLCGGKQSAARTGSTVIFVNAICSAIFFRYSIHTWRASAERLGVADAQQAGGVHQVAREEVGVLGRGQPLHLLPEQGGPPIRIYTRVCGCASLHRHNAVGRIHRKGG